MDLDGVYKSGFATTQKAYEDAVLPLFDSLDRLEKILSGKDHLVGSQLTEADVRLFVTIVSIFSWHKFFCGLVMIARLRYDSMLPTTGPSSATFVLSVTAILPFTCELLSFDMCHVATS